MNRKGYNFLGPMTDDERRNGIPSNEVEWGKEVKSSRCYRTATFAAVILAVIVAGIAIGFGIAAYSYYGYFNSPSLISYGGPLPVTPYVFYITASGSPAALTLPNNLANYVGNVYRIWSLTNQPHTITIQGMGSTFNGAATVATFGGAIGDGFVFEVISANFIRVIQAVNVIFI